MTQPSPTRVACRFVEAISADPVLPVPSPKIPGRLWKTMEDEDGRPIQPGKRWAEGVKWTQKTLGKSVQNPRVVMDDIEEALKDPRAADWDVFERKVLPAALAKAGPSQYKKSIELAEAATRKMEGGYIRPTTQKWMPKGKRYVSERENWIFWEAVKATATELHEDWQYSAVLDSYKEDAKAWAKGRWRELWE
jgi:hypothetical protein